MSTKPDDFARLGHDLLRFLYDHPMTRGQDPLLLGFGIVIEIRENEFHGLVRDIMQDRDFAFTADARSLNEWHRTGVIEYKGIKFKRMDPEPRKRGPVARNRRGDWHI